MKINRRKFLKRGFWLTVLILLLDAFWFEKFFVRFREHKRNKTQTPPIKILEISDIHMRSFGYGWKRLCGHINAAQPDLICFTGDAVDKNSELSEFEKILKALDINIPKVAILGNWEYWGNADIESLKTTYQKYNCTLLVNQHKQFQFKNKTLTITGVDDWLGGTPNYTLAAPKVATDVHIVLNHCPQYNSNIFKEVTPTVPIDFILSGHTHGGQINLLGYVPFLPPGCGKYLSGWYEQDAVPAFVSKGIGCNLLPVRFGARAEVNIFYV